MTPDPVGVKQIVLLECPVELLAQSRAHNDALMRELAFATADADRDAAPVRLLELVDELRRRLAGLDADVEDQLAAARAADAPVVDLQVTLPRDGRDVALELAKLFDEAEEYCRRGELLTVAESEEPRRFRTWYLEEYVRQLDGEQARPWPHWRAAAGRER
jgi:hypothetical protein